ncbi:hypothetical protein FDT66_09705 [Polaribacter aestuariivivens]|uniref:Uncharacterized protein n=1 Tax=Polaribacter aestuariivivens TaxID=2304626 RepID=A0A5S3N264_9FLAO|nr:hypothetical protein [Polaribacter aestuariivivens]TMM29391.1 hypothetical protein FDT66_09705 [Polaribacter aestuariivivens]
MFLYKLKEIENSLEEKIASEKSLLDAVISLKNILLKINFEVEDIPEYSFDKILKLLEVVKKSPLTKNEQIILRKIIHKK